MTARRWLLALPVVVLVVLLQSAFWAPTYESQGEGNAQRLTTYIEAGIGDAKILNPVISADGASSDVEALVFNGLIDVDENDAWVGALAERWDTTEEAYLTVLPGRTLAGGARATASAVADRVRKALAGGALTDLADTVAAVAVVPAARSERDLELTEAGEDGRPVLRTVSVTVDAPARVRFDLTRVVPEWFDRLEPVLGAEVLAEEGVEAHIQTAEDADRPAVLDRRAELLVVREHRPVLTFHLRKDVRFHDGHPFDANDVRFTYEAIMDPKTVSPRTSSYEPVRSVQVIDDHTVRVVYKRLYSPGIFAWSMGMLPEHLMSDAALEAEMDRRGITGEARESFGLKQSETARNPVGTGPFRFIEWQKDEYIHLTRFDDYWKGPAELSDVYMRVVPDLVTQEVEFRAGAVDRYGALPHQVARFRADPRYQTISTVTAAYSYIGYNLRKPIFQDVRVRRALAMAIDVEELVRYVLYGEGEAISGPSYVDTPFYDYDTPIVAYDPEGAKGLLAEAGYTPGPDGILQKDGQRLEFKLITNNGNPQRKAIITVAQDAWKRIGIDVATQTFEWTVFLEEFVNSLEFDAIVLGWSGGRLNPDKFQLWHSSQTNPYQLNFTGLEDPRVDVLIERIRVEYDLERQAELARELHALIASLQPYTFLYAPTASVVLDPRMVIVERDESGRESIRPIEAVHGTIKFYIDRWRKLRQVPVFSEQG